MSISRSATKARSFENLPKCGSANHGGIFFVTTADLMALDQGRTCCIRQEAHWSYFRRDDGSPGSGSAESAPHPYRR